MRWALQGCAKLKPTFSENASWFETSNVVFSCISQSVLPKLRSLPDDVPASYFSMLIRCMVRWGWSKRVLELIRDWLSDLAEEEDASMEIQTTNDVSVLRLQLEIYNAQVHHRRPFTR